MPQLERHHLDEAAQAGLISGAQASALWSFLCEHASALVAGHATFSLSNVLHYLGGMLAIGAMSIFATLGWEQFGGAGVFFIALLTSPSPGNWRPVSKRSGRRSPAASWPPLHWCCAARGVGPAAGAGAVGRVCTPSTIASITASSTGAGPPSSWPPWRPAR